LFFLVLVVSFFLQVDGFSHGATEIHHGVSGVSPIQRLVAAGEPEGGKRCKGIQRLVRGLTWFRNGNVSAVEHNVYQSGPVAWNVLNTGFVLGLSN